MKFRIFFTYLHLFDKNDWNKFCTNMISPSNLNLPFQKAFEFDSNNKPGSPPFFQWHRYHDRPPTPLENGETFPPLRQFERGRGGRVSTNQAISRRFFAPESRHRTLGDGCHQLLSKLTQFVKRTFCKQDGSKDACSLVILY